MSSAGASSTSSAMSSWPGVTIPAQIAICFFLAIAVAWLVIGIPTLIGVGWNNTASKAEGSSVSLLRTQTQNGFAMQNNSVQSNFVAATRLPAGRVNVGGLNGFASPVLLTGDVTLSPSGQVTVNPKAIKNSQLTDPAQYIITTFPKNLSPIPYWRNSVTGFFNSDALLQAFPFGTVNFGVSVFSRNRPSATSRPTVDENVTLVQPSALMQLFLTASNVLRLELFPSLEVIVEGQVPASVTNRAFWTVYSFSQQFSPAGWIYSIFADDLLIATATRATVAQPTVPLNLISWRYGDLNDPIELGGSYVYREDNPESQVLTLQDLQRLVVLGPGNTFSNKFCPTLYAAYELYNTPGYPLVSASPGTIKQTYVATPQIFKLSTVNVQNLTWLIYNNEALGMLQPSRVSSLIVDFTVPQNVTTVNVIITATVIIPYNSVGVPSVAPLILTMYGATVSRDAYSSLVEIDTSELEQTLIIRGIPTTANAEDVIAKWTIELVRDDTAPAAPVFFVGVRSIVVQGIVP